MVLNLAFGPLKFKFWRGNYGVLNVRNVLSVIPEFLKFDLKTLRTTQMW
jgi:hypothetical protein